MSYFDARISDARDATKKANSGKVLELIDEEVTFDCSVCSMLPGFPADLALDVNRLILRYSREANVVEARPNYGTREEHIERLVAMCEGLKAVFEELARRNIEGFSEHPRSGVDHLYNKAARLREKLAKEQVVQA